MYNRQEIIGHLGSDAEVKQVGDNRKVVKLRIAANHRFLRKGEEVTHTEWFDVEFFCTDRQGEYFGRNLLSGALVRAEGRTETERFEGSNGTEHFKKIVKCEPVGVLLLKPAAPKQAAQPAPDARPRQQPSTNQAPQRHEAPAGVSREDLLNWDA
jgi:single stranded DNA-binding protein